MSTNFEVSYQIVDGFFRCSCELSAFDIEFHCTSFLTLELGKILHRSSIAIYVQSICIWSMRKITRLSVSLVCKTGNFLWVIKRAIQNILTLNRGSIVLRTMRSSAVFCLRLSDVAIVNWIFKLIRTHIYFSCHFVRSIHRSINA